MKRNLLYILCGCTLLSGCHLYSNYERSESISNTEGLYRDTANVTEMLATRDTSNFGNLTWQEVFVEPQLQALIEKALKNNVDIKKAEFNIQKAQAGLKVSKLAYIPSMAIAPQGTVSSFDWNKASQTYSLPLSVSWNLGQMGNLRNLRKQANVSLIQTKVAKQATQSAIVGGVANLYYTLTMLDEQLRTTKSTIALWKKNVEAMEAMKEAAMVNEAAVSQTKANYYELQASVPALENSIRQTENALCLLLGETPHAIERGAFNTETFPQSFSVGLPLHLLSNRPDVMLAELQLSSLFYEVNIARSGFYPGLNLTGTLMFTNSGGGAVFNPGKMIASAVASVTQPIFQNGLLRANLKIKKLDYESAELQFRQTLLQAGADVSNALAAYQATVEQQTLREQEVSEMEKANENIQFLFTHTNTTSYLETLTAQQSLLSAQLALINDKYNKVQSVIKLYQALGGGRY